MSSLAQINKHIRDANISFEAGPHIYTINDGLNKTGQQSKYTSVTTWNHSHFAKFDADAIITTMMKGRGWPKSKYFGQTREEIKAGWERGRDEAAALGTEMHYQIECYYGGGPPTAPHSDFGVDLGDYKTDMGVDGLEKLAGHPRGDYKTGMGVNGGPPRGADGGVPPVYFMNFIKACPNLKPYRTEWMIYHEDLLLAGSIDMVYENPDGTLMIYDWKRAKDIKKSDAFMKYALTECISHVPDTNFWHYALQLNTYKAILEQKYGKKVTKLVLVCLHPSKANFEVIPVPVLATEMEALFALRREQIAL